MDDSLHSIISSPFLRIINRCKIYELTFKNNPVCPNSDNNFEKKRGDFIADWNADRSFFFSPSTLWASVTPAVNMFAIKWWCPVMMLIMMRLRAEEMMIKRPCSVYYCKNLRAASVDAAFAIFVKHDASSKSELRCGWSPFVMIWTAKHNLLHKECSRKLTWFYGTQVHFCSYIY